VESAKCGPPVKNPPRLAIGTKGPNAFNLTRAIEIVFKCWGKFDAWKMLLPKLDFFRTLNQGGVSSIFPDRSATRCTLIHVADILEELSDRHVYRWFPGCQMPGVELPFEVGRLHGGRPFRRGFRGRREGGFCGPDADNGGKKSTARRLRLKRGKKKRRFRRHKTADVRFVSRALYRAKFGNVAKALGGPRGSPG